MHPFYTRVASLSWKIGSLFPERGSTPELRCSFLNNDKGTFMRHLATLTGKNRFTSVQLLVMSDSLRPHGWTAAHQASLSIFNSRSLPKLMSIESAVPSNHLILCHPLLLLPSVFPSIRVFSNESALRIRKKLSAIVKI